MVQSVDLFGLKNSWEELKNKCNSGSLAITETKYLNPQKYGMLKWNLYTDIWIQLIKVEIWGIESYCWHSREYYYCL